MARLGKHPIDLRRAIAYLPSIMNAQSVCSRWRAEAWECGLRDALIDPAYFSPPVPPVGAPVLTVLAFHRSYPEGRRFERTALGERWVRVS